MLFERFLGRSHVPEPERGGIMAPTPRADLASFRSKTRRGRPLDSARRDELLGRLEELVLAEGFARLTVDDLAARLHCSKSTLYAISSSREYLVATAIRHFFRDATSRIEASIRDIRDPAARIAAYLAGVGTEMRRMSPQCYEDMVSSDLAAEIYAVNSAAAARRVREFIHGGVESGAFRDVNAAFVGEAVALLIDGIQHGVLLSRTGMSSGDAYPELGRLVLAALLNKADHVPA
jgi:AcrR family transcriptional regulator